jgi:hypothetical protein
MSFSLLRVEPYDLGKTTSRTQELKWLVSTPVTQNLIAMNLLTGNKFPLTTKNSAGGGCPPIEKADETHKRDLFGWTLQ